MKKYQHEVDTIQQFGARAVDDENNLIKKRGIEGWELVSVIHSNVFNYYYWKREIIEAKELLV
jgi:hypothetical protein